MLYISLVLERELCCCEDYSYAELEMSCFGKNAFVLQTRNFCLTGVCDCICDPLHAVVGWLQKAKLMETLITVFKASVSYPDTGLFLALDCESI